MKKTNKKILAALLTTACAGAVVGCGENRYKITAEVDSNEYGYIKGGGEYTNGETVKLKIYPNEGCQVSGMNFNGVALDNPNISAIRSEDYKLKYYEYSFQLNSGINDSVSNVGKYTAVFSCSLNTTSSFDTPQNKVNMVEFAVLIGSNNENRELIEEQKVIHGQKAKEINYVDEVEGRIEWYTDKNCTAKYNFNNPVTNPMTLYGKINNSSAKEIVKDAMDNLNSSERLKMEIGKYSSMISKNAEGSNAEMKFEFYDNGVLQFILEDNNYYEVIDNKWYKLNLEGGNFNLNAKDVSGYNMFFEHNDLLSVQNNYNFEQAFSNNNPVKKEITIGKNENNESIKINCSKYLVKTKDGILKWNLYINKGKIYRIEKVVEEGNNVINNVTYPETFGTHSFESSDGYLIKFATNNTTLGNEFYKLKINDVFEKMLKVRPSNGETIKTMLENNDEIRNLLKKYDYTMKELNSDGAEIDHSNYNIGDNLVLYFDVFAELSEIEKAIKDLKNGGYYILNSGEIRDDKDEVEYVVESKVNVFDFDNKPIGMDEYLWKTLMKMNDVVSSDFYRFECDEETKVYSFYEKEEDSFPFITIKLLEGKISEVVYVHKYINSFGTVNMTTYTSTFDYTIREYLNAMNDISEGGWDVKFGTNGSYRESNGLNLIKAQENTFSIDSGLWDMLHLLDDLAVKSKYTVAYSNGVYTFTNVSDSSKIYTVSITNGRIDKVVANAVEYTFDYTYKGYFNAIKELEKGIWDVKFGTNGSYRELEGNDLLEEGIGQPTGMDETLYNMLQNLEKLLDSSQYTAEFNKAASKYTFTNKTSATNKYIVTLKDGKILTVEVGGTTYVFDYTYRDYLKILNEIENGKWNVTYTIGEEEKFYSEKEGANLIIEGASKPTNMEQDLFDMLQTLDDLINKTNYTVTYDEEKLTYVFTRDAGVVVTTYTIVRNDDFNFSIKVKNIISTGSKDIVEEEEYVFDYTYKEYLLALDDIAKGRWRVTYGNYEYLESNGANLIANGVSRPSISGDYIITDNLWDLLKNLINFTNPDEFELKEYDVEKSIYVFEDIKGDKQGYKYEVKINNGVITSIKSIYSGRENVYEFNYDHKLYLEALDSIKEGMWDVTYGGKTYSVVDDSDITSLTTKPDNMENSLWLVLQELKNLTLRKYEFVYDEVSCSYTFTNRQNTSSVYTVILSEGKIKSITYGEATYVFDHKTNV